MFREKLLEAVGDRDPTPDILRDFMLEYMAEHNLVQTGYMHLLNDLVNLQQLGQFDAMFKMKLIIAVIDLIAEFSILDEMLNTTTYTLRATYLYEHAMSTLAKTYRRAVSAKKYKGYHHNISIKYEPVKKEKKK